jgi:nucleoside-diphosphate-sugar epimerase
VAAVMIEMAQRADAAGEIYCIAAESSTVGELSNRVAGILARPRRPIAIPRPILAVLRTIVWNRAVSRGVPRSARLAFWRLSLIVSDGFWFDTAKFQRAYAKPLRTLEEGLPDILPRGRTT